MPKELKQRRDNRKQSIYLPTDVIADMKKEADRLGISSSKLMQKAWMISRMTLREYQAGTM